MPLKSIFRVLCFFTSPITNTSDHHYVARKEYRRGKAVGSVEVAVLHQRLQRNAFFTTIVVSTTLRQSAVSVRPPAALMAREWSEARW